MHISNMFCFDVSRHTQCTQHFQQRVVARLRTRGKGFIQAFTSKPSILGELSHATGASNILDGNKPVSCLQGPGDAQEGGGLGQGGVSLKNVRPEDNVGEAGFVLQGHEGDTGSGTGMIGHEFLILQIRTRVL